MYFFLCILEYFQQKEIDTGHSPYLFFEKSPKLMIEKTFFGECGNYVRREAEGAGELRGESESLHTSAICWCKLSSLRPNRHNYFGKTIIILKKIGSSIFLQLILGLK